MRAAASVRSRPSAAGHARPASRLHGAFCERYRYNGPQALRLICEIDYAGRGASPNLETPLLRSQSAPPRALPRLLGLEVAAWVPPGFLYLSLALLLLVGSEPRTAAAAYHDARSGAAHALS